MENQGRQTTIYEPNRFEFAGDVGDRDDTQTRIDILLKANLEFERENSLYINEQERHEAALMKNPITTQKAVAYFGAMLGLFPPCAMFSKFLFDNPRKPEIIVILLLILVNITCAVAGYFSGKLIGKGLASIEKLSWHKMILIVPFLGIVWGIMTGGAGGIFIFVIGAFFGAVIAAMVGAAALPAFAVLHRLLKRGETIEEKHFFPIAMGITSIITALILGL
jgi:hypothetical protein